MRNRFSLVGFKFPRALLYLSILALSSCAGRSYLLPATSGNDVAYLAKPMASDSIKSKNYISASYAELSLPNTPTTLGMGFVNFHRAHTFKSINLAYGAFGFFGNSANYAESQSSNLNDFSKKYFSGYGLRSSLNFFDTNGNSEFRLLGWENALSIENGSYLRYRNEVSKRNQSDVVASTLRTTYTTGFSSELIFHGKRKPDNHFAFRFFYGFTPRLQSSLTTIDGNEIRVRAFDFSFYFKSGNFFGIFSTGENKGSSNKLTLGYSF